ncbi:hypothetical protein EOL96_06735 [Candidatus Saccharibacteria bacterium]|nr:hypothetical protein [Candidatus Saccharibacteria bacterium]
MKLIKKRDVIIIVVILLILVVFELSPWGGNLRFYGKWMSCGQKPVMTALTFGGEVKYYTQSPSFKPIRSYQPTYFCTPLEAEKAGYSANPDYYDFPNLNE